MKKIVLSILCIACVGSVFGQKVKPKEKSISVTTDVSDADVKGKKKIRIVKNINGNVEVTEKIVDADSLDQMNGTVVHEDMNTTVIVKSDSLGEEVWEGRGPGKSKKNVRVYKFDNRGIGEGVGREIDIQMDNLSHMMQEVPRNFRGAKAYIYDDNTTRVTPNKGIRNLDVYTNIPETNIINVRFYAGTEGDIKITVVDLNGQVVSKAEEKAFKGEYMDQIRLPKETKGTFFVIVSQGNDGISRKVKIADSSEDENKK